jgi:Flp pilus assembly protein TadG
MKNWFGNVFFKEDGMNLRFVRKKDPAQSLPIIALVIIVIVGLVALSVDLGNTYAQQREVVRASEAAASSAMQQVIDGTSDAAVADALYASLSQNGILTDTYEVEAYYITSAGELAFDCQVGTCGDLVTNTQNHDIAFIEIRIKGKNDTFFASVLGQDTLPVSAQSYAGQCAPTTGVYPIGISAGSIGWVRDPLPMDEGGVGTQKGFVAPEQSEMQHYFIYSTGAGDNAEFNRLRQRRIYLDPELGRGGTFAFLRWRDEATVDAVQEMFHIDGNLGSGGLQEVSTFRDGAEWPFADARPEGYPLKPGEITPGEQGDWLQGLPLDLQGGSGGFTLGDGQMAEQLNYHVTNRTLMILPIINEHNGVVLETDGANPSRYTYQVEALGHFMLTEYGTDGEGRQYMDMVYVGDSDPSACSTDTISVYEKHGVIGRVLIEPLAEKGDATTTPTQFVVVMDVSGSMNLNFLGQGTRGNGKTVQCDYSGDPALDRFRAGCTNLPYHDETQRRNAVVKQAIIDYFVNRMGSNDAMALVSYSSNGEIESYKHTTTSADYDLYSAFGGEQYWFYGDKPADKGRLAEVVMAAGAKNGNPFITSGFTASARGLDEARKLLQGTEEEFQTRTHPEGQPDLPYKRVVVFLTDGVANVFLGKVEGKNRVDQLDPRYTDNCPAGFDNITSSIPCNMGVLGPDDDSSYQEVALPVTAMVNVSQDDLQTDLESDVFSIAVGQVGEMGLVDVASQPAYFSRVARAGEIGGVFTNVRRQSVTGCRVDGITGRWAENVDPANYPIGSAWADATGAPLVELAPDKPAVDLRASTNPKIVGNVTFKKDLGDGILGPDQIVPIELETDRYDRPVMSFHLNQEQGLAPGNYRYTAYVIYKGNDGISRQYDSIYDIEQGVEVGAEGTIFIPESDRKDVRLDPIYLKLSEDLCQDESEEVAENPDIPGGDTPEDGTPEDGTPEDGTPEDGTPEDGTPEDGTPEDGTPEDGTPEDGTPEDGTPEDGTPEDGTPEDGTPEDGTPEDGTPEDGTPEDGTPEDGTPEDSAVCEVWTDADEQGPVELSTAEASYNVQFRGATNHGDGTSTWTYYVEELSGKDLSHWTLGLPSCVSVERTSVTPSQGVEYGLDPTTGVNGIKWDTTDNFSSGEFSFTFTAINCDGGSVEVGETTAAVKTGGQGSDKTAESTIAGPVVCETENP